MEKITANVYVEISGRGCNHSMVATSAGPVMIDTPMMPDDAVNWKTEIAKFGNLQYVINCEPHADHVSGNYFFDAPIVAHEGTRKVLLEMKTTEYTEMLKRLNPNATPPPDYSYRSPTITLSERMTLYVGKHTFQLIHTPGHTPYQVAVYIPEERVVCTSDNVTYQVAPFMHQAEPFQWIESLKKLKKLDLVKIVPGHGQVCGPEHLDTQIEIIQGAIDTMQDAIKKGMTLEEIQKNIALFKQFPKNERTAMIQNIGMARLYEILKK